MCQIFHKIANQFEQFSTSQNGSCMFKKLMLSNSHIFYVLNTQQLLAKNSSGKTWLMLFKEPLAFVTITYKKIFQGFNSKNSSGKCHLLFNFHVWELLTFHQYSTARLHIFLRIFSTTVCTHTINKGTNGLNSRQVLKILKRDLWEGDVLCITIHFSSQDDLNYIN